MPLIIPQTLPAYKALEEENVFVMHRARAMTQDIRPLRILLVNLMPTKIATETQIARMLANSPLQVELTLLHMDSHESTHVPGAHLEAFYKTFDEIKTERFDGMIVTGAPVEMLAYEEVDYWPELCAIFEYSKTHVYSTVHICWGAQAALYYHYGIHKRVLPQKVFGIFAHRVTRPKNPLVRGFDEVFPPYRALPRGGGRLPCAACAGRKRQGRAAYPRHGFRPPDLCVRPYGIRPRHPAPGVRARR